MKGSLKASILNYFWSLILFPLIPASKFSLLFFCFPGVMLLYSSARVAVAVPQQIAQVSAASINRPTLRVGSQGDSVSELQAALKLLGFYTGAVDGTYNESTVIAVSRFQQAAGLSPDGIVGPSTWQKLFPAVPGSTTAASAPTNTPTPFPTPSRVASTSVPNNTPTTNPKPTNTRATNPKPAATNSRRTQPARQATPSRTQSNSAELPILRLGMRGPDVTRLQQRLQALGLFKGGIDGDFGPATEAAVKAAQERFKLEPDGVVGPATWAAILRRR